MTKKYILLKEQIQSTIGTSEFPPSSTAVKNALDGKVDVETGKRLMTEAEGTKLAGIDTGAQVNVIEEVKVGGVAQTITDKAVNVPIATASGLGVVKIGTGLSVTAEGLVTADVQLHFEVFQPLPTASETYKNTIALVKKTGTTGDVYNEYACVQDATTKAWAWELIGTTEFVLTITQTAAGITINGTALQAATTTQNGLMTSTQVSALEGAVSDIAELETSVSGINSRLTTAEGDIEELETGKADAADVEALEGRVETAESDIDALESGKVDKETGKALVETSKVTAYDAHLADDDIHVTATDKQGWDAHVASTANPHGVTKAQVGLGNADNTSDADKPISTATQAALDAKVDLAAGSVSIGKDTNGYYFNE